VHSETACHEISSSEDAILRARVRFLFGGMPLATSVTVVTSCLATLILARAQPSRGLYAYAWFAAMLGLAFVQTLQYLAFCRTQRSGNVGWASWRRRFLIGCTAVGVMWGVASLLLFPQEITDQVFLSFVIGGTSAGALATLSSDCSVALAFVVPSIGPLAVTLMLQGSSVTVAINGLQIEHPYGETYRWAIIEDIGQCKAVELQRRTLNDRLLLAASAAAFSIWEFDSQHGKLTWDAKMYAIFGTDLVDEPDLSRAWRSRVHPDDLARAEAQIEAAVRGETGFADEYRLVLPSGAEKAIRAAAMMRHNPQDGSYRLTGVTWDVTALRRVDRLKIEFISTVSHELRTPLTSIRAVLSLVTHGVAGELNAQVRQLLAVADRNAERLALLIDDLLDLEKIEAGKLKFELTDQPLRPLLEQAIAANAPYAKLCSVHFELLPGGDTLVVRTDTNRLLQVMANLLFNAAKFSPGQSTVTVSLTARDGRARAEVRDQGPGIGPELRQRLFTKFTQGDGSDTRSRGGTGLGHAISKALIERMGGSIDFDSTPGRGATFYFELPLLRGESGHGGA
jgi:signal transduction histidine kinase